MAAATDIAMVGLRRPGAGQSVIAGASRPDGLTALPATVRRAPGDLRFRIRRLPDVAGNGAGSPSRKNPQSRKDEAVHTGRMSGRLAQIVPSRADVILYCINSVLQDEPPREELRTALRRTRAVRIPTREER
jgi:hypothetical protein